MPGKLKGVINTRDEHAPPPKGSNAPDRREGVVWFLDDDRVLQHPMLRPFKEWRQKENINIVREPRRAWRYWEVEKLPEASAIVEYDDTDDPAKRPRRPALLERAAGKGRVVLFTTRLDAPWEWNDYLDPQNAWAVTVPNLLMKYLAGDTEDANFNHQAGQTVTVPLPRAAGVKREAVVLEGPGVVGRDAVIQPGENQTELRLGPPRVLAAGNFTLSTPADLTWREGFSLNAPADESTLEKVPAEAIEELTGKNTVVPVGKDLNLADALKETDTFKQPLDLFPWLLIAVLMLLVVEGLVANRFYRRK
jgi:hypothetical protein